MKERLSPQPGNTISTLVYNHRIAVNNIRKLEGWYMEALGKRDVLRDQLGRVEARIEDQAWWAFEEIRRQQEDPEYVRDLGRARAENRFATAKGALSAVEMIARSVSHEYYGKLMNSLEEQWMLQYDKKKTKEV